MPSISWCLVELSALLAEMLEEGCPVVCIASGSGEELGLVGLWEWALGVPLLPVLSLAFPRRDPRLC